MAKRAAAFFVSLLLLITGSAVASPNFSDDADAIEEAANSVFLLEVYSRNNSKIAVGSGFVAFDGSTLITNYHVIEDGAYIVAISDDYERYYITQICAVNKARDIAILLFEEPNVADPLELDTNDDLKRAQPVVAIGSPAGLMNTVSIGNISAFFDREGKDWIQFTAPISSGSSGGALLNDEGKVIGITTATYASTQNINLAVKAKYVQELYSSWDGKKTTGMDGKNNRPAKPQNTNVSASDTETHTVYVSRSGRKYHNNPTCSGMHNSVEMDLLDAVEKGYTPCGKCYK